MNPDMHSYQPEANLPPPIPEKDGDIANGKQAEQEAVRSEKESRNVELPQTAQLPSTDPAALATALPSAPPPITPAAPTTAAHHQSAPAAADDVDLIEKEWVIKAKSIVEGTKDDPHRQNKEISKFKADYIKKRYNKEIKVSEE